MALIVGIDAFFETYDHLREGKTYGRQEGRDIITKVYIYLTNEELLR
jgi:hypothetical protein